jgi:hypothetical protein
LPKEAVMRSILPLFLVPLAASAPALAQEAVPVPAFRSVELRGGGEVVVRPGPVQRVTILDGSSRFTRIYARRDGELKIDACDERCPQHYRLRVEIQSPRVPDVAVSGGGSIATLGGFRPQSELAAAVNGGGGIDLRSVEVRDVTAAVNGGGRINVRPGASLTAAVSGGGSIRYWGNPAVTQAVQGGGSIGPGR